MFHNRRRLAIAALLTTCCVISLALTVQAARPTSYTLRLAAGERQVMPQSTDDFFAASKTSPYGVRGAIIQFYDLPDALTRQSLEALGVQLYEYLPDNAYFASIPSSVQESDIAAAGVRWVGVLQPDEKLAEPLRLEGTPEWSRNEEGVPRFTIKLYHHVNLDDAAQWLADEYGATVVGEGKLAHAVDVTLPAENWYDIAGDERVSWIEPFIPRKEANNSNRANTGSEVAQDPPYSAEGAGVVVGEWDGGGVDASHTDFGGRVVSGDGSGPANHATHCAGTVLGSGAQSGGTYRGMAPSATMVSYRWWTANGELEDEYQDAIDNHAMDLTTNSWIVGYAPSSIEQCESFLGNYFMSCGTLDDIIRGDLGKTVAVCWAAGNERSGGSDYCGSLGMTWGTVPPYGTAKNTMTVGAINSNNSTMTSFSSWGPVDDGRLKPEVVAPGCQSDGDYGVTSTRVGGGYLTYCGTSMATPTTAGCFAQWLGRYKELYPGQVPLGSTLKAAFVQSADDIGDPGPEFDFGYGRINVPKALDVVESAAFFEDEITDGDTLSWTFAFDGNKPEVRFTVAWDDPGAALNAIPALINDIDIRVQTGGPFPLTLRPWSLDPSEPGNDAIPGEDHTNNLEQVYRDSHLMGPGTWRLLVIGYNIPDGPQKFSIAHTPGFAMVPEQQPYAAALSSGADISIIPGDHPVDFHLFNTGREDDTYDITLTSTQGWTLTPNPAAVSVAGRGDSALVFTHAIPLGTPPGIVDTVVAAFASQTDPGISGEDTVVVTVIAGYGVVIDAIGDTASVPGENVVFDAVVTNAGTQGDVIDWSVSDDLGWSITPASGTVSLPLAGSTTLTLTAVVDGGATPGTSNHIVVSGVSQSDPEATGEFTTQINVIEFPPPPALVSLKNQALTADNTPELTWTHNAYTAPPPGFDVFTYSIEFGLDTGVTLDVARYNAVADTVFTSPVALSDGVHYWRVITFNADGDSSGFSPSASFEIDATRPDAPMLLTPPNMSGGTDATPTFTWGEVTAKIAAATGQMTYRWEMSYDSAFGTIDDSLITTLRTYTVPAFKPFPACSTDIYWRVSATDAAGNVSDTAQPFFHRLFIAGDVNRDCTIDALDLSELIDFLFAGKSVPFPPDRCEMNCVFGTDALDLSYLIDYLFAGGDPPCVP